MSTLLGRKLGKYEIVDRLAQGGMAEVYKAHQSGVERMVVVKVLHCHLANSASFTERFRREALAVGSLQHPNIVRIIDFDTEDELQYMVMDYVQGGTLSDQLKAQQRPSLIETLHMGAQLASALAYAHQQGVIHRDIKPGNILFADSSFEHPVLTDFGLAHLCSDDLSILTMTGAMIGTPTYMSPEAVRGEKCDARADIYSLGVVLYELFTGTPPYIANSPYSMMMKLANEPLPPPRQLNPDLPRELEDILLKALAKDPGERYQSASELADVLQNAQTALQLGSKATVDSVGCAPSKPVKVEAAQPLIQKEAVSPRVVTPVSKRQAHHPWLPLAFAAGGVGLVAIALTALLMMV